MYLDLQLLHGKVDQVIRIPVAKQAHNGVLDLHNVVVVGAQDGLVLVQECQQTLKVTLADPGHFLLDCLIAWCRFSKFLTKCDYFYYHI